MCCVPALFVVIAAVHKKFTKFFRANGKKVPSWLLRGLINEPSCCLPIEGQIENWMTVRMGYDLAMTSPAGSERGNAAVRFRGRNRKTTFGENGKQSANFSRNSSVLHPWFLLFMGKAVLRSRPQIFAEFLLQKRWTAPASSTAFPLENP